MSDVLGIDESGRGPVIGPMVIVAAVIEEDRVQELVDLGVRDSKLLTAAKRKEVYEKLKHILKDYMILKISAREIDDALMSKTSNLNKLEIEKFGYMIKTLSPEKAIVDAPEVNTDRFTQYLEVIAKNGTEIISENKADTKYPIVGAASIIAKVERDMEIDKIKEECGVDFGVGYPHDERTIAFLKKLLEDHGDFPDYVRKSWATAIKMKKERQQRSLGQF